jgi:uncharacterized protein (DUF433 family)
MDYRKIITIEPGKRGGKPSIRGLRITVGDVLGWIAAGMSWKELRITVGDVLGWIAAGMSWKEITEDYPDLTNEDIQACLEFAADRERHTTIALTRHETAL